MSVYRNSDSAEVVLIVVHSVLVIVNIAGNVLVCVIIVKNREMRTSLNYLILNLAVADITTAVFLSPKYIFSHFIAHPEGAAGTALCIALTGGIIGWVGAATGVFCLVAIAVERYYAVVYPFENMEALSKRKLKVIIISTWILGIIFNIPSFMYRRYNEYWNYCINTWPREWVGKAYSLYWFCLAVLSTSLMAILYFRVVYTLWFKHEDMRENNTQQKAVLKVRKRATLMVILVSVVFGVCWVTDRTNYLMVQFYSHTGAFLSLAASNTMVLVNSAINPILYALVSYRFREKAKRMIQGSCCRSAAVRPAGGLQVMASQSRRAGDISSKC